MTKFKAWIKKLKKMVMVDSIDWTLKTISFSTEDIKYGTAELKDVILLQSIGLCDKHGNEIFEGDIIDVETTSYYFEDYIVSYDTNHLRFVATNDKNKNDEPYNRIPLNNEWDFEIVGNIYENKR